MCAAVTGAFPSQLTTPTNSKTIARFDLFSWNERPETTNEQSETNNEQSETNNEQSETTNEQNISVQ